MSLDSVEFLHDAIVDNDIDVVRMLLTEQNVDVGSQCDGEYPIGLAVRMGLKSWKIDQNPDLFGKSMKIMEKHIEMIRYLCASHARLNVHTDYHQSTPLMIAAAAGAVPIVKVLVRYTEEVFQMNIFGLNAYDLVVALESKKSDPARLAVKEILHEKMFTVKARQMNRWLANIE
jgi:ankyrin repeat protein